jgi:death on curing protein
MTVFLTEKQILFIHARLIETTGGEHGLRDLGLLQSAAARPKASFDGQDLYQDVFQKTAALLELLTQNHPFVDGNKRTAITSSALFLLQNNFQLQVTNQEMERFSMFIVKERPDINTIAAWFEKHSIPIS